MFDLNKDLNTRNEKAQRIFYVRERDEADFKSETGSKNDINSSNYGMVEKTNYSVTSLGNFPNQEVGFRNRKTGLHDSNHNETEDETDFKSLTTTFCKKSSIYALNQIGNSRTTKRKVFWALILIGGLIGCCSQVYRYLDAYYHYPVVVNIDSKSVFNQFYPAITVCNLNNIRSEFQYCLWKKISKEDCKGDLLNKDFDPKDMEINENFPCFAEENMKLTDEILMQTQISNSYTSIDNKSQKYYGHQPKEMIRSCSFNGEECSYKNFTFHPDSVFGSCFSFNKVSVNQIPLRTAFVGPNSGLMLEMDIQSKDYSWWTKSVGARIVIHDPYQEPLPQEQGINLSPGFETILGLSKTAMVRLPDPYKDHCKDYSKENSQKQCNMECVEKQILRKCKCNLNKKSNKSDRYCNLSNGTDFCCVYEIEEDDDDQSCECPLECLSSSYQVKISSAIWPLTGKNVGLDMNIEEIRENLLKVKVYFDTLEQLIYKQKPMFDDAEVLSQIGGQMGLWLGLSLAAMFECVENVVLLWYYKNK